MNRLKYMTIKTRMMSAFILMIVLFIIFGGISMNQMSALGDLTSTLYDHPLRVSNAALKAKAGIISMHRSMKDVSVSPDQLAIHTAIRKVQSEEERVYKELSIIQSHILGQEGKKLVEETTLMFAGWEPIRSEVGKLILEGDSVNANKITREKGADYVMRLERQVSKLTAYALGKAEAFMDEAKAVENKTFKNGIIFVVILILLAAIIGFLMSSSILSDVTCLKNTMEKITETGELVTSDLDGDNEITQMSIHFNRLIERLRDQFWLGDGRNTLNQALSGQLTYDDLLTRSIEQVSRYVDACAGVLYSFNAEEGVCELKASYAFVERKHLSNRFKLGEGIVGQVAVEKTAILLKNITSRDAIGQSGTISETPVAIYAIPLFHEETLFGVLEVASFEEITQTKQHYLNSAADIISVFLHAASQNDRIKNLLAVSQEANEKLQAQAEELSAQTEELKAMNNEFQQQADELKEQNAALEAQRQQVEEANRLKSEFLSNMSHELRTPLNSVNALSRVLTLQAKEKLSKEEMNYLEIIERNGKHLLALINDILDLSKIEAGKMDIHLTRFSLKTLIDTIVEGMTSLAAQKKINIKQDVPKTLPKIESDESRVFQILQNIIANAVKFTDEGVVEIAAENDGDQFIIKIRDTGIGISSAHTKTIFEEFRQVDGASTRKFEGTGLGLAIADKAAKMLGGHIDVESTLGVGSTFTIHLPVVYSGPEKALQAIENNFTPSMANSDPSQNKTILIVDDDPDVLNMISDALIEQGYQTMMTTSGKEAIQFARENQLFAITLDVVMPEMDGWEVLAQLKKDPATSDIPVIIVSVSNDKDTGVALGAAGYIAKSETTREQLMDSITGMLPKIGKKGGAFNKPPATEKDRILLIEDNEAAIIQVKNAVESLGISVDVARDGRQGIDYMQHTIPGGIILDLMMPNIDGFEVLETIRGTQKTKNIPVLVLTAKDLTAADLQRLSSNNIQQLVQKGDVDRQSLLGKISNMIKGPCQDPSQKKISLPEANTAHSPVIKRDLPCVLVVEDNPDNMTTIKAVLGPAYIVEEAADGEQGLHKAFELQPDLILLDISLPKMDGITVVKKLKENEQTKNLPVIALTAQAMKGDKEKLMRSGCEDYIAKPFEPEIMIKKLKKWIKRNI